ncbi:hypothetical protein V8F20_004786 [Naviculisporaceae sp. PSN 640]
MSSSTQQNNEAAPEHDHNNPQSPQFQGTSNVNMPRVRSSPQELPHHAGGSVAEPSANRNLPFDPIRDLDPTPVTPRGPDLPSQHEFDIRTPNRRHNAGNYGRNAFSSPGYHASINPRTPSLRPASEIAHDTPSPAGIHPRTPAGPSPRPSVYASPGSSSRISAAHESPMDARPPSHGYNSLPPTATLGRPNRIPRPSETPDNCPASSPGPRQPRRSRSRSPLREPARPIRQREEEPEWLRRMRASVEGEYRPELGKRYGPKFRNCRRCQRLHLKCDKPPGHEKCDECFKHNVECVKPEEGEIEPRPKRKSRRPRREDPGNRRRDDEEDDDDHRGGAGRHFNAVGGGSTGPIVID